MNKIAMAALMLAFSGPAIAAEPIVLECELPASETPNFKFPKWHSLIPIDETWTVNDCAFLKQTARDRKMVISRSSGTMVVTIGNDERIGTCKRASKDDRRF